MPGVVDVAGPRADGALIVATAGGLLAVPPDGDTAPGQALATGIGSPTAIALSPGLDVAGAACRFGASEVFALDASTSPPAVVRADATGQANRFFELAQFERIKRFAVLPTEVTIEGGELTPTMKLRRRIVEERWAAVIEQLY
ncbi:MAG: hypothetical protein Q8K72_03920, partial [Acidimicrobiales bacterium]|nr:hypothetical protein [Acidimicrobiales bacterium]